MRMPSIFAGRVKKGHEAANAPLKSVYDATFGSSELMPTCASYTLREASCPVGLSCCLCI